MPRRSPISWSRRCRCCRAPSIRSTSLSPTFRAVSHANPFFYVISGFRYGFLGVSDSPLLVGATAAAGAQPRAVGALLCAAEERLEDQELSDVLSRLSIHTIIATADNGRVQSVHRSHSARRQNARPSTAAARRATMRKLLVSVALADRHGRAPLLRLRPSDYGAAYGYSQRGHGRAAVNGLIARSCSACRRSRHRSAASTAPRRHLAASDSRRACDRASAQPTIRPSGSNFVRSAGGVDGNREFGDSCRAQRHDRDSTAATTATKRSRPPPRLSRHQAVDRREGAAD